MAGVSSGWIWTVTQPGYTVVFLGVGVFLGLALTSAQRIVAHAFAGLAHLVFFRGDSTQEDQATNESPSKNRDAWRNCCSSASLKAHFPRYLSIVFVIVGVTWTVLSTLVTKPTAGEAVLSGVKRCGVWGLADDANGVLQDADALLQGDKEATAGQYARKCYGSQATTGINQCLLFTEPFIESSIETDQPCPFVNRTYCTGNGFEAVKFSTGLVDAKHIGLNIAKGPRFNRTTVCVPLNLDAGFALTPDDDPSADRWDYDLGPVDSDKRKSPYTFQQYVNPFRSDVRSYTMR